MASRACLACRDKKIKCDGELRTSYSKAPTTTQAQNFNTFYKKCSNCLSSGIECVFVPSKRGGSRRKKPNSAIVDIAPGGTPKSLDGDDRAINNPSVVSESVASSGYKAKYKTMSMINATAPSEVIPPQDLPLSQRQQQQQQPQPQPPPPPPQQQPQPQQYYMPNMPYMMPNMTYQNYQQAQYHAAHGYPTQYVSHNDPTSSHSSQVTSGPSGITRLSSQTLPSSQRMYMEGMYPNFYQHPQQMHMAMQVPMQVPMQIPMPMQMSMQIPMTMSPQVQGYSTLHGNYADGQRMYDPQYRAQHGSQNNLMPPPLQPPTAMSSTSMPVLGSAPKTMESGIMGAAPVPGKSIDFEDKTSKFYIDHPSKGDPNHISKSQLISDSKEMRDTDSWSASLAPSDSVTVIQEKRQLSAEVRHPGHISEREKKLRNDDGPGKSESERGGESKDHLPKSMYGIPTSSPLKPTEQSHTEKWISEQKSVLKRKTSEINASNVNGVDQRENRLKRVKLDLKLPSFVTAELLESVGLPKFETFYKMVGVFYKYCNPHTLVLPNMSFVMDTLHISDNTLTIIGAMMRVSCKYMKNTEVEDDKFLDESYWDAMIHKHESKCSTLYTLLSQIIQCARADDAYIHRCIEIMTISRMDQFLNNAMIKKIEHLNINLRLNSKCLLDREILIRVYWNVFKAQIFRRLSFGYPYPRPDGEPILKVTKDIEVPIPDTSYYNGTEHLELFKSVYGRSVPLNSISTASPDGSKLYDSVCLVMSLLLLEEVTDAIANKTLFDYTLLKFTDAIKKIYQLHSDELYEHLKPYRLEKHNGGKPVIVMNSSNFTSAFINRMTLMMISLHFTMDLLLFQPKKIGKFRSQVNLCDDYSIVEVDPKLIFEKSAEIKDPKLRLKSWSWLFTAVDTVRLMIVLLQLGDGVHMPRINEKRSHYDVHESVMGPCCCGVDDFAKWRQYNEWTMNASNVSVENQGWIQMHGITVWAFAQALPIFATFSLALLEVDVVLMTEEEEGDGDEEDVTADVDQEKRYETFTFLGIDYDAYKRRSFKIIRKDNGAEIVRGIRFTAAPAIFALILMHNDANMMVRHCIERMKLAQKFLNVLGKYHGDCRMVAAYCDKLVDYIVRLVRERGTGSAE